MSQHISTNTTVFSIVIRLRSPDKPLIGLRVRSCANRFEVKYPLPLLYTVPSISRCSRSYKGRREEGFTDICIGFTIDISSADGVW